MTSKANTTTVPTSINATMNPEALLDALLAMSSTVTPSSIIEAVNALPDGPNTEKIGALCVAASMSVKGVIDAVTQQSGVIVPNDWLVNGTVNMSMFAMAGHLIFLLGDEDLTTAGRAARPFYARTLGNKSNLAQFGNSGTVEGKSERSKILREWSDRLKSVNLDEVRTSFGDKFKVLVRPSKVTIFTPFKLFSRTFPRLSRLVTFPMRSLKSLLSSSYMIGIILLFLYLSPSTRPALFLTFDTVVTLVSALVSYLSTILVSYLPDLGVSKVVEVSSESIPMEVVSNFTMAKEALSLEISAANTLFRDGDLTLTARAIYSLGPFFYSYLYACTMYGIKLSSILWEYLSAWDEDSASDVSFEHEEGLDSLIPESIPKDENRVSDLNDLMDVLKEDLEGNADEL